ncbi:hypothetical protein [Streptomyces sp. E5N298]|uniref:hypothetical protein n=1 Tax=Streptomyces sp. E5N298 TaxID=1851983 RepID=UPI00187D5EED|nr:hypothetical protein [Streptomyces sp. E5N298]
MTDQTTETARLRDEILSLRAELAQVRDLLRSENQRANAAIGREETAEQAALEAEQERDRALAVSPAALPPADQTALEALSDTLYDALYAITPFAEKYFVDEGEGLRNAVRAVLEQAAVLPATTNHNTDTAKLAATLREVLDTFGPMHDVYGGPVSYYDGSADITPAQYEGWRAVLDGALRRVADETAATETARGCPPDCPCRAVCIGTLKPAGARKNRPPATACSDGKGRVYCIGCHTTVGADVPLTANDVEPHELCASCGRHVVDVAAAGARQDGADRG